MPRTYKPHQDDNNAAIEALRTAELGRLSITSTERASLEAVIAAFTWDTECHQTTICAAHDAIDRMRRIPATRPLPASG